MRTAKRKNQHAAHSTSGKGKISIRPKCGLCGKTTKLIKTPCCNHWICDDQDKYVLFSYARNSCFRNHDRYTLCSYHYHEGHEGSWQNCTKCSKAFELEMYVYFGTNEYNFEKLKSLPKYEPTKCSKCGQIIRLGEDGCTMSGKEYWCEKCASIEMSKMYGQIRNSKGRQ